MEEPETQEERQARIEKYAAAVEYFLDHPDAPINPILRAFIENFRRRLEEEGRKDGSQATLTVN